MLIRSQDKETLIMLDNVSICETNDNPNGNTAFEKIIKKIKERYNTVNPYVRDSVVQIVEQVAEEYKDDWIPCSERLPEKSGEYLVTYHPCYWDSVQDGVKVGIDTFRGKTTWARNKYQKVIAWKTLPEAYIEKMGV